MGAGRKQRSKFFSIFIWRFVLRVLGTWEEAEDFFFFFKKKILKKILRILIFAGVGQA